VIGPCFDIASCLRNGLQTDAFRQLVLGHEEDGNLAGSDTKLEPSSSWHYRNIPEKSALSINEQPGAKPRSSLHLRSISDHLIEGTENGQRFQADFG
jgi:hypothetical protein